MAKAQGEEFVFPDEVDEKSKTKPADDEVTFEIDANGILTACLFALDSFRDGRPVEDDVSMVVIKVTK